MKKDPAKNSGSRKKSGPSKHNRQKTNDDKPAIFGTKKSPKRRNFIKYFAGSLGLSALTGAVNSCDQSDFAVNVVGDKCICHVVCSCDTVGKESSERTAKWGREMEGDVCTCDRVCTCHTVCSCDTVCTCDCEGGSSCSGCGYWYPN